MSTYPRQERPAKKNHLDFVVDSLEQRTMLSADALFSIAETFSQANVDFDEAAYAEYLNQLHNEHHDDHHDDELLHVTPLAPVAAQGDDPIWANYDLAQTFELHSLAGADHTIYLDFDGHVTTDTYWNNSYGAEITTPAYDVDGDAGSFSETELARIQQIWTRVAEDFAPFHVNVTTEDPGADALRDTGGSDSQWGIRVVVGENTFYSSAGGVAYVGSFDWSTDTPAFVFNTSVVGVAEAASHEAGHALGLRHDGTSSASYYSGHGSGDTSWGPIMGASYYRSLTQWSQGEYNGADRQEDDLQIITTQNGFGYRADDYGNSTMDAQALAAVGSSTFETTYGIIERNTDVDYFSFFAGAGQATIEIDTLSVGANLDILAELYDSDGNLIGQSNPLDGIDASFDVELVSGGQYFVTVTGTGLGNPNGDGYTDYGSLGNYRVTGEVVAYDGIVIQAAGTTNSEQFLLQIDGSTVATFNDIGGDADAGIFETYTYDATGITAGQVRIVFTNDLIDENGDRNLRIDNVTIGGTIIETESAGVYSTGTWTEADGIQAGFGRGDTLHANGYFQFGLPETTITVRASGDEGTELFELLIDGDSIGQAFVSTSFDTYAFSYAGDVEASQLRIVFSGDQYDSASGLDTNLHVDWVDVAGVTYQTDSADVYSTGTRTAAGVMPGFARGETLHTDGYFQFGVTAPIEVTAAEFGNLSLTRTRLTLSGSDAPLTINLTDGTISNDTSYVVIPDAIRRIVLTGTSGSSDHLTIIGTTGDDTATVRTTSARLKGDGILLTARKFESLNLYASAGNDKAIIRGNGRGTQRYQSHDQTTIFASDTFAFTFYDFEATDASRALLQLL